MNSQEEYIRFLETINKSDDIESLYQEAFKIIYQIFKPDRILILENIDSSNETSVFYEYFEGAKVPIIKYRLPLVSEKEKISTQNNKLWQIEDLKNNEFNKYKIFSLTGIDLNFNQNKKGCLVLTSEKKDKKYDLEEMEFLLKLKEILEPIVQKIEKYTKALKDIKTLHDQNHRLREQDRLRTNFINNMSHEIRTPLASILGFSKILVAKAQAPEEMKETSNQIQQAASRLSTLITDFLQINKIETEGWLANYEPCDVGEIIKNTVEEFSCLNKNHKITYLISNNYPIIKTDPKLFRQILDNLILNAIKYSPKGGNISVKLNTSGNQKEISVSVTDEGLGIHKDEISQIFKRFFRSNHTEVQKTSGSGLGLAICKEIIESLSGKIEVESELNKGSEFTFILPIK